PVEAAAATAAVAPTGGVAARACGLVILGRTAAPRLRAAALLPCGCRVANPCVDGGAGVRALGALGAGRFACLLDCGGAGLAAFRFGCAGAALLTLGADLPVVAAGGVGRST